MVNVLDLFSGIGGFSLGLERAGMRTVAFCEPEPFCRAVLAKHWPSVPCYDDVRTLTAERLAADGISVDVICGGFPCQDISLAGRGAGLAGERSGLWFEFHRLIAEIKPRYAIIENVTALRSRGLDVVLRGISEIGYDAEWHCIRAARAGLPHSRDRLWIVVYPCGSRVESLDFPKPLRIDSEESCRRELARALDAAIPADDYARTRGNIDGVPAIMDRLKALGNAVVPQIPEIIGRAIMEKQ